MNKETIKAVTLITVLLGLANVAFANQDPVGVYVCIAQRVVGIQGDEQKGKRYHGRIRLNDEEKNFLMTITDIDDSERVTICEMA